MIGRGSPRPITAKHLAVLVVGLVVMSLGVWNAGIPIGDEGRHLLSAIELVDSGTWSSNLYLTSYAVLLRTVTDDPMVAHVVMRFATMLAAALGVYGVLTAFPGGSRLAVVVAALAFGGSRLANPPSQSGNVNLFALALVLPGLGFLLRERTLNGILVFMIAALAAALVRLEYLAAAVSVPLVCVGILVLANRARRVEPRRFSYRRLAAGVGLATVVAGLGWYVVAGLDRDVLDPYLLHGFGQNYAVRYKSRHPAEHFQPMTEYRLVLDRAFGTPRTVLEAVRNNPREAAEFLMSNAARNVRAIVPGLLRSTSGFRTAVVFLVFGAGTIVGVARLVRGRSGSTAWDTRFKIGATVGFASASFVAIVVHVPDPRFWVAWVPAIYLWFAWAVEALLGTPMATGVKRLTVVAVVVTLCYPHLLAVHSNQALVRSLRTEAQGLSANPTVAGNDPVPWVSIAFRGRARPVSGVELSADDLRGRRYDVFLASNLDEESAWQQERAFLAAFRAGPGRFGYRLVRDPDGTSSDVFVRAR